MLEHKYAFASISANFSQTSLISADVNPCPSGRSQQFQEDAGRFATEFDLTSYGILPQMPTNTYMDA
jgi:hypothetical protein